MFVRDTVLGVTSALALPATGRHACSLALGKDALWALWSTDEPYLDEDTNGADDLLQTDLLTGISYYASWNPEQDVAGNGASASRRDDLDGHYVAFQSTSSDLVPGDANGVQDVFVADMEFGTVNKLARGSVTTHPISDDNKVVFTSTGSVPGLPAVTSGPVLYDGAAYVALHYRTDNVLVAAGGTGAYINADGTRVSFSTTSPLKQSAPADTNNVSDVYLRSVTGTPATTLVSTSSAGGISTGGAVGSTAGPLSSNGSFVTFGSEQTDLVPVAPGSGVTDVYRWSAGAKVRVSDVDSAHPGDGDSAAPDATTDGAFAVYRTAANNLTGAGSVVQVVVTRVG